MPRLVVGQLRSLLSVTHCSETGKRVLPFLKLHETVLAWLLGPRPLKIREVVDLKTYDTEIQVDSLSQLGCRNHLPSVLCLLPKR
jgi:hypothetical protein